MLMDETGGGGRRSCSNGERMLKDGDFEEQQKWEYHSSSTSPNLVGGKGSTNSSSKADYSSSSAPMDIPDWRKIYGTAAHEATHSNNEEILKTGCFYKHENGDDDYDYDDGGEMIPPHEYIAKKLARCQISSFSVCEGAGRTLKGRDLSRVRNAILTKTGFLEQ